MTDEERFCNKRCSLNPCRHRCEYVSNYLNGLTEGRKEKQTIIDSQTVSIESRDVYLAEKENIILRQQSEIEQLKKKNVLFIREHYKPKDIIRGKSWGWL